MTAKVEKRSERMLLFDNLKDVLIISVVVGHIAESYIGKSHLLRIITILLALVIGFALIAILPNRKIVLLSKMGTKTLQVYFWHMPIIYVLRHVHCYENLQKIFGEKGGTFLLLLLGIALAVILTLPLFSHPTAEFSKTKKTNKPQAMQTSNIQNAVKEGDIKANNQQDNLPVLELNHVSIRYMTGDFKDIGLKEYVMRKLKKDYHVSEFWADKNISFSLQKGDMLGIIGTNGSGKSTLLKAVSGIMEPTKGSVKRRGSIAALLELGSGFDKDLTVRENTYLRGAMLGYTRKFMDNTYQQIIEFAELEEFQDRPFKQLSSGMKSRLAFSIASLVEPDILILDEVLSVGDGAFRKKSENKMKEIISGGTTTILVSHSLEQVRAMCNKVLWLDKGEQVEFGNDVQKICDRYAHFLEEKGKTSKD